MKKTLILVIALLATGVLSIQAQYQVVEHGANYRVWQTTNNVGGTNRVHKYTELATGMYYTNSSGQWVESKEEIETFARGAIARQGPYQVIFANNLNSAGAIDLQTPDGKRLRSNILGLAYNDDSTGQSVLIAQIQNSQGELISSNQVLYPDAFDGVVKADVRYTYRKGSFEQDVILRTQPPAPESFGLNPRTTEIEVLTEFINPPKAKVAEHKMKNNSLADDDVDWGVMRIGHGKAFDLGEQKKNHSRVTVRRQYVTAQNRNVLVEGVSMQSIQANLANLPQQTSVAAKLPAVASKTLALPNTPLAKVEQRPMRLAAATPANRGFVLDYVELNTDQGDYTFQGYLTYYIDGGVNLGGTTVIEGGAVIKYNTNSASSINILGTVECQTTPYWPAILTSSGDDTAGEPLNIDTGPPPFPPCTGNFWLEVDNDDDVNDMMVHITDSNGNTVVNWTTITADNLAEFNFNAGFGEQYTFDYEFYPDWRVQETEFNPTLQGGRIQVTDGSGTAYDESGDSLCTPTALEETALFLANGGNLHDLDIRYAETGIYNAGTVYDEGSCSVTNVQFVHCAAAFQMESASLYAENILMSDVGTGFSGQSFQATAVNLTFDQGLFVTSDPGLDTSSSVSLVNSLITGVPIYGNVPVYTNAVATLASGAGVYQSGPLGNYYLPPDSPFIDAGTPTADRLGLYWWTTQTNQAIDGVTPVDLGYHYPAVDANGNPIDTDGDGIPDYLEDPNGYGLPEWWETNNFGSYSYFATALDPLGNSLLYDYTNYVDFTAAVSFTVRLGNQQFNTTSATGSYVVISGVPYYEAVLVNDTNLNDAVWQPYDGNITLNLGPTDGVYQVWFGLAGLTTNTQPTWMGTSVTLNRSKPQIFITNPTTNVVTTPYVQLQGYSALPLAGVTFDVSNAVSFATNQLGSIIGHTVDTNTLSYTTDYFQCFDIPLTNGINAITLHCTDPAGNVTLTNINITLDYTTASNPAVNLGWPQDGAQLSCSNFTLRGWTEDASATVSAQITDTNGDTNMVRGIVERTGVFWINNLPLASGTNILTLFVTNSAGYSSVTNISLVQSSLVLTMNPVSDDLWLPAVTVTGNVGDATYAVWVNGVKAVVTTNGDGTGSWVAHQVPVTPGGVASFDMTAYAPDETQPDGSHGNGN